MSEPGVPQRETKIRPLALPSESVVAKIEVQTTSFEGAGSQVAGRELRRRWAAHQECADKRWVLPSDHPKKSGRRAPALQVRNRECDLDSGERAA